MVSKSGSNCRHRHNLWGCLDGMVGRGVLLAIAAVALTGCSEKRVPVFPVSGKVNFQGKPPAGAQVVLQPVNAKDTEEVFPQGQVQPDGSFAITSYDSGDGAPQGDYVAVFHWYKFDKDRGGPGPNVIPATYTSAKTSPVKVSVNNGPTDIPPITIK